MRRFILLLSCFVICSASYSQKLTERLDSIITIREEKAKYDTAYIQRPKQNWSFRLRLNGSGWRIRYTQNDGERTSDFSTKPKETLAIGANYRGLAVGFAINPAKLLKKNTDTEYSVASYGNRMGFDAFYHLSRDFEATSTIGSETTDMSDAVDRISMFSFSSYYALNGRKFSFPAALSQSYIQKRSAGSWLLSANAFYADGRLNNMVVFERGATKLHMLMFGVGGGYGYNFVFGKRNDWMLHLSAAPTVVFAHYNYLESNGKKERIHYLFPELMNSSRIALVHSFGNKFAGFSAVFNMNNIGSKHEQSLNNTKWKVRVFLGMRL